MTVEHIHIPSRSPAESPDAEGPQDELFDWQKLYGHLRFSFASVFRRPWLFLTIAGAMILLAAGALAVFPKTYEVEARLLAQKNAVLAVRADSNAWETPTRSASDTILGRENLHALIRETGLINEWPKRRAPILRLKDRIMARLQPPPSEEERLNALTGLLSKNLNVWTTPDGTVTIRLHWPDPVMAYRLVDSAQQNYLESRHVAEISTIAEQIAILEGHSGKLKADLDKAMDELQRLRGRNAGNREASRRIAATPLVPQDSPEVINLRVMLEAKRRAIADLDDFRRHHYVEQQTKLTELAAIYSDKNPMVLNLKQSVEALQTDSPQLRLLRQQESELKRELAKLTGGGGEGTQPVPVNIPADLFRGDAFNDDPTLDYARSQLQFAAMQFAMMRERIASTRLDLDTARAAFKHRYSVIMPAEIPKGPIKQKAGLVMIAASIAGLVLAMFGTVTVDIRSGAVLERWQLERLLGPMSNTPVIELRLP